MSSEGETGPEPRLRVAVVSGRNHPDFDLALIATLTKEADVLVCASSDHPEELETLGARVVLRTPWPRHREILKNIRLIARLSRAIRDFRPDVVHILSEGQVWVGLLPDLLPDLPFVLSLHDVRPHPGDTETRKIPRPLVRRLVRRADALIVHGKGLRTEAARVFGVRREKIFVSVHPVIERYRKIADAEGFRRGSDGPLRVLFYGRILPYKGLGVLLEAERRLPDALARVLVVAGRGEAPAAATPEEALRREFRVRPVSDRETAEVFASADILALPYLEASQSGVLAIGLSFDLPVVATDVGELGPLVRAHGLGLVAPPGDGAALAEALGQLLADADLRDRCRIRSREARERVFAPDAIFSSLKAAYVFASKGR